MSEKTPTPTYNSTAAATAALRDAFIAIRPRIAALTQSDIQYVRGRVSMLVRAMQSQGTLPERVTDIVRQIATESGVTIAGHQVLEDAVRYCVAEYYTPSDAAESDS
jgi:hypothetical protein